MAKKLMPVMLPPGRLRLETRPAVTGSSPMLNTIGIVAVAGHQLLLARCPVATIARDLATDQVGRQSGKPSQGHYPPSGIRSSRLAFHKTRSRQGLGEMRQADWPKPLVLLRRNPITGIAGCCARAASGHAPPRRRAA